MAIPRFLTVCLIVIFSITASTEAYRATIDSENGQKKGLGIHYPRPKHHETLNALEDDNDAIYIWPMPASVARGNSSISVSPALQLQFIVGGSSCDDSNSNSFVVSDAFNRYKDILFSHLKPRADILEPVDPADPYLSIGDDNLLRHVIVNVTSDDETLDYDTDESYILYVPDVTQSSEAYIQANSVYGGLRGLETFSQLCVFNFTSKSVQIKHAPWEIQDAPRFKYRGILIDTSRHYQPLAVIKQVIDSMAYAKFNVLHWHIVDEESFPLEIPSLPKLWMGSYTPLERYTISDAEEIVRYAKARGIKVMAEIDVPGHAESWGYGYPDLWPSSSCREPIDVSQNFTFEVINNILSDLRDVFPFGFFHLGGDEVDTGCWNKTPRIKQWLDEQGLTPHEAYVYFVLRAQELALSHGWDPVNWEETFNEFANKLSPRTIVHNWLGPGVAPKVVAKGFRCIVSNQDVWYLDHLNIPWKSFYNNEPLSGITNSSQQELVLGGEVCMWGETVDASDLLQTIWPRAAAAAERLWSPFEYTNNNIDEAENRLEYFRCLLNLRNIAAAPVNNPLARRSPTGPGSCYFQ